MGKPITLDLPLPPSPNKILNSHHMKIARRKNAYRKEAWVAAVMQSLPVRDPPDRVKIHATIYYSRNPRDPDNAVASLKWALDTLRQKQVGSIDWKQGIANEKAYFIDDSPAHMELEVEQVKILHDKDQKLTVVITPL